MTSGDFLSDLPGVCWCGEPGCSTTRPDVSLLSPPAWLSLTGQTGAQLGLSIPDSASLEPSHPSHEEQHPCCSVQWSLDLSAQLVCTERLPQVGFTEEALAWPAREPEDTAQEHQVLWRKP